MSYPWLDIAEGELGVVEIPGPRSHQKIVEYHSATSGGKAPDGVPWCSSFVCWLMRQSGIPHPASKSSQAWLKWGVGAPVTRGAIGVIRNPIRRYRGHVGIVAGYDYRMRIVLLGGNQKDAVSYRAYPFRKFVSFRLPALWATNPMLPLMVPSGVGGSTR